MQLTKRKLLSVLLPLLLGVSAFAQNTPAATPPSSAPGRIAVVDIQTVILATNEGRRDFEGLQKKFEPTQTELQKLNQEVEDLKKQLQAQSGKLNEDARGGLVKSIEAKQKNLQRQGEDAQTEFQQQRDEIAARILQKLGPVLDAFAKKENFAVVLDASQPWPQGQVVWAAQQVDVTEQIVKSYNEQSGVAAPAGGAGGVPSAPSAPSAAPKAAPSRPAAPKPAAPAPPAPAPSR